jgi:hypothetical protein
MNKLIEAVEIKIKWEKYRDTIKGLYLIDKEKGEKEYKEMIELYQKAIRDDMEKRKCTEIQSIIKLSQDAEPMVAVEIITAGYEMLTKEEEKPQVKVFDCEFKNCSLNNGSGGCFSTLTKKCKSIPDEFNEDLIR